MMGITEAARRRAGRDGWLRRSAGVAGVGLQDGLDDVALDQFAFLAGAEAEGLVGDAIDVAEGAGGR